MKKTALILALTYLVGTQLNTLVSDKLPGEPPKTVVIGVGTTTPPIVVPDLTDDPNPWGDED